MGCPSIGSLRRAVSNYPVNQENASRVLPLIRAFAAFCPPSARLPGIPEINFGGGVQFMGWIRRVINSDKIWNCLPS
jgi:hypothetical protein